MDQLHARYDPVLGTAVVDVMERLSLFAVFRSPWFSAALVVLVISIVVCTLDRTPRLWRGVQRHPGRPARAVLRPAPARPRGDGRRGRRTTSDAVLRRNGFRVREATDADGTRFLYGDRHQYTKMATLLTHLGLILFLLAAAVTSRLGDEQGLVVAEGESLTVQPIGTPGLLLVKNLDFEAPGFDTGKPDRLHDRPGRLPGRPADRAQDDPGQRPAVGRRLHVPPERLRAGAAHRAQDAAGAVAVGRARADDRRRWTACRTPPSASPAGTWACKLLLDKAADGDRRSSSPSRTGRRHRAGRPADRRTCTRRSTSQRGEAQVVAGPGPVDRPDRLRRVHAADRQARPRPGPRLDRLRVRSSPASPSRSTGRAAGSGRGSPRTGGWASSGARTATSTSSASSGGCSTSSSPSAARPEPRRRE